MSIEQLRQIQSETQAAWSSRFNGNVLVLRPPNSYVELRLSISSQGKTRTTLADVGVNGTYWRANSERYTAETVAILKHALRALSPTYAALTPNQVNRDAAVVAGMRVAPENRVLLPAPTGFVGKQIAGTPLHRLLLLGTYLQEDAPLVCNMDNEAFAAWTRSTPLDMLESLLDILPQNKGVHPTKVALRRRMGCTDNTPLTLSLKGFSTTVTETSMPSVYGARAHYLQQQLLAKGASDQLLARLPWQTNAANHVYLDRSKLKKLKGVDGYAWFPGDSRRNYIVFPDYNPDDSRGLLVDTYQPYLTKSGTIPTADVRQLLGIDASTTLSSEWTGFSADKGELVLEEESPPTEVLPADFKTALGYLYPCIREISEITDSKWVVGKQGFRKLVVKAIAGGAEAYFEDHGQRVPREQWSDAMKHFLGFVCAATERGDMDRVLQRYLSPPPAASRPYVERMYTCPLDFDNNGQLREVATAYAGRLTFDETSPVKTSDADLQRVLNSVLTRAATLRGYVCSEEGNSLYLRHADGIHWKLTVCAGELIVETGWEGAGWKKATAREKTALRDMLAHPTLGKAVKFEPEEVDMVPLPQTKGLHGPKTTVKNPIPLAPGLDPEALNGSLAYGVDAFHLYMLADRTLEQGLRADPAFVDGLARSVETLGGTCRVVQASPDMIKIEAKPPASHADLVITLRQDAVDSSGYTSGSFEEAWLLALLRETPLPEGTPVSTVKDWCAKLDLAFDESSGDIGHGSDHVCTWVHNGVVRVPTSKARAWIASENVGMLWRKLQILGLALPSLKGIARSLEGHVDVVGDPLQSVVRRSKEWASRFAPLDKLAQVALSRGWVAELEQAAVLIQNPNHAGTKFRFNIDASGIASFRTIHDGTLLPPIAGKIGSDAEVEHVRALLESTNCENTGAFHQIMHTPYGGGDVRLPNALSRVAETDLARCIADGEGMNAPRAAWATVHLLFCRGSNYYDRERSTWEVSSSWTDAHTLRLGSEATTLVLAANPRLRLTAAIVQKMLSYRATRSDPLCIAPQLGIFPEDTEGGDAVIKVVQGDTVLEGITSFERKLIERMLPEHQVDLLLRSTPQLDSAPSSGESWSYPRESSVREDAASALLPGGSLRVFCTRDAQFDTQRCPRFELVGTATWEQAHRDLAKLLTTWRENSLEIPPHFALLLQKLALHLPAPRSPFHIPEADLRQAKVRVAGRQLAKMTTVPLAMATGMNLDNQVGQAVLQVGLSLALPHVQAGPRTEELSKEMRIDGMALLGDEIVDLIAGPLRQVLADMLSPKEHVPPAVPLQETPQLGDKKETLEDTLQREGETHARSEET